MTQTIVAVGCPKGVFIGIAALEYETDNPEEFKFFEEQEAGIYFQEGSVLPNEPKGHYYSGDGFAFVAQRDRSPEHKGLNSLLSMQTIEQIREGIANGFEHIREFNKKRAHEKLTRLSKEADKRGLEVIADTALIERSKVIKKGDEFFDTNYFLFVVDRKLYMVQPYGEAVDSYIVLISDPGSTFREAACMAGLIPEDAVHFKSIATCFTNPDIPDSEKIDDYKAHHIVEELVLAANTDKLGQEIEHCQEKGLPAEKIDLTTEFVFISDVTKNKFVTGKESQFLELYERGKHLIRPESSIIHIPTQGEIDFFS
ncbi:hypothetical protein KY310_01180 [Candidatus Woesearchaeota archaeon]|nr:hypothetical protein [Candidatus Woesearchaeota archaeon]